MKSFFTNCTTIWISKEEKKISFDTKKKWETETFESFEEMNLFIKKKMEEGYQMEG